MEDTLKEERLKILELLKEGTISPDQAESLLSALMSNQKEEVQLEVQKDKKSPFRMLKISVDSSDGEKVRVNIPVEFAKLLKKGKFGNVSLDEFDIDIDSLLEMINHGVIGEIITVDSEDGDKVRIFVE